METRTDQPDAPSTVAMITERNSALIARARTLFAELEAQTPTDPRALIEKVDGLQLVLLNAGSEVGVLSEVHPDLAVRESTERLSREVTRLVTAVNQSGRIHDALAALDPEALDTPERRMVELTLRDMRRAGAALGPSGQQRAQELRERITALSQDYSRNIRDDVRTVELPSSALEGLPADYVAAHPVQGGVVRVTTDPPDMQPLMAYSRDRAARKTLATAYQDRAPGNRAVFEALRLARHELATLLGYPSWAAYNIEDKMAGTPEEVDAFLSRVSEVAREPAKRIAAELLTIARRDDPAADRIGDWDVAYHLTVLKTERLRFDPRSVRPYLEYRTVRQAILDLAAELFRMTFTPIELPDSWHPSVEHFAVTMDGRPAGRISLDMHPREGKNKWFFSFGMVAGIKDRQLPHNVLVCNFPDPSRANGPALMEHSHVVTFFHEFGHLVHGLARRDVPYARLARPAENDFMEAPSRFLEDHIFDLGVLRRFARHIETDEPIGAELVGRLRAAREFGQALTAERSVTQSRLALALHAGDPRGTDARTIASEIAATTSRLAELEDTNHPVNWTHMSNESYSASYYTYLWSNVIANDLASAFPDGPLDPERTLRYRDLVLAPGGLKPAAEAVAEFLGRPYRFDAFAARLRGSAETAVT
ncbi:MAG TPA: M3 family metallopeptidase [Candidatus Saccharimonadales bacterium]|nr:M3 family metallopeptidase [Candidatus Saccharimonadales bacterium]